MSAEANPRSALSQAHDLAARLDAATQSDEWSGAQALDLEVRAAADAVVRSLHQGRLEREAAVSALQRLRAAHGRLMSASLEARDAVAADMRDLADGRRGVRSYLDCGANLG